MSELKNCPFCGSKPTNTKIYAKIDWTDDLDTRYMATCDTCRFTLTAEAWNRRAGEEVAPAKNDGDYFDEQIVDLQRTVNDTLDQQGKLLDFADELNAEMRVQIATLMAMRERVDAVEKRVEVLEGTHGCEDHYNELAKRVEVLEKGYNPGQG